jgi:glycosyltransferase involved in cell wall biosynthesis
VLAPHAPGLASEWRDGPLAVRTFRYAPQAFERLGYGRSLVADERPRLGAALVAPLYLLAAARAVRAATATRADLVHLHWVVPNALVLALPGILRRGVVAAVGVHGSDVFLAERSLLRPLVRRALRRAELLTGCSGELVERVRRVARGPESAEVIPYGVDGATFSPDSERGAVRRHRLGIPPDAAVVLGVGRMATKKGFQVLVQVLPSLLERFPAAHVVLAGAGDLRAELMAATSKPSFAGRVHFPGAVAHDELPDLYRAADLFVLPAMHDARGNVDGLPNVILEAMASGLPVVSTRVSGIPLAIESGLDGILVAERDARALEQAIAELLADAPRRRQLGERARRRVLDELTWDRVADRYRAAYAAVLGRAGGAAPSPAG